MKPGRITAKTVQNDKAAAILKKARFLAAPEMKTIEIGVVGKFVTVKVLNSYENFMQLPHIRTSSCSGRSFRP